MLVNLALTVGIVGGGISGLYTALLLQRQGHHVRIFEGSGRIGGRVHTHYFTTEENQYYEAGAMRVPKSVFHQIFYQLVDYVNSQDPANNLDLIEYILTSPGNDVYFGGERIEIQATDTTPAILGWEVPPEYMHKTAQGLLTEAVGGFVERLKQNFETEFNNIVRDLDHFTFRFYCQSVMDWPDIIIDFVETVMSQTNQFSLSVPELIMQSMDFDEKEWRTIKGGMSRLPQAMAKLVGYKNITFGARVTGLHMVKYDDGRSKARITATGYNGILRADFDRVVFAIPPAALRMIVDRPRWSVEKEMAIRSMHFEALYKMGLRFKTRFWERVEPNPSVGGQSTTDLPIRWIVFPSNGIERDGIDGRGTRDKGPGVLLVYAW